MSVMPEMIAELFRGEIVDGPDVARVLGTSPRSVNRWVNAGSLPRRESEERLLELKAVIDLLREVLREEPARLWFRTPNPTLDHEKPIELVERGEYRRVIGAIKALGEGVTA